MRRSIGWLTVAAFTLVGCDTGDGTRLQEPTTATTIPPPDTTPLETLPLGDEVPTVDGLELATLPTVAVDGAVAATAPVLEPASDVEVLSDFALFAPWAAGGLIDPRHGCDGDDLSPAVSWTGLPAGTVEVAVALVDDTAIADGRPVIHWVLAGVDAATDRIGENEVPLGALQALNSFGEIGYTGPCPDLGDSNNYVLTVWALGQQLELPDGASGGEMLDLVATVSLDSVSTVGTATR